MKSERWTVVKVGGSLFDMPDLRARLNAWLGQLDADRVMLVPGGGATADVIRALDRVHRLGAEASHWLALHAMSLNAFFLQTLLPDAVRSAVVPPDDAMGRIFILDALPFFQAQERGPDPLPHRWDVTSDSLAARVAILGQARALILLKSTNWLGNDWTEAIRAGVVDAYFAHAIRQAPTTMSIRIMNWRT